MKDNFNENNEEKDLQPLDSQMNIFEYKEQKQSSAKQTEQKESIDGQIDLFNLESNEKQIELEKKIEQRKEITEILKRAEQQQQEEVEKQQQSSEKMQESGENLQQSQDFDNAVGVVDAQNAKQVSSTVELVKERRRKKEPSDDGDNNDGLQRQSIDEVLHNSMIPYSEFVLMDRALPRVEDGLKPVQRRILYSMLDLGITPDKAFKKSARIVGECLGKYHPHGDTSVYDAMVRMAQPFNMRGCLVEGHGNFGSIDGDSAAAMRYTEARLAPLAMELLRDIEKNTVPFSLNFDDTLLEPDLLPGRYPNLLVNGAMGIAVGLATNIPPHNLGEVIDGTIAMIESPKISLKEMMQYIKGPDFPTGAIISTDELEQAYETGRGKITMRAKVEFEKAEGGKTNIVITEVPYQKNKSTMLAKIAEIREEKKGILLGISDIKDETDRRGIRAVITVKQGYDPQKILAVLYKYSDLQTSYGINMVAIANGKPRLMGLLEILRYYIDYQIEVIVKRTKFDLDNAKERVHILEGLYIAITNIDEVVAIIKSSPSPLEAKTRLRERFDLSEKQAQAILDMRLARLTNLEVYKIEKEIAELRVLVEKLTAILNSKRLQYKTLKEELLDIKKRFKTPRCTQIVRAFDEVDVGAILEENKPVEETVVMLTRGGTIKRMSPKQFETAVKEWTPMISEFEMHYNILKTQTDKVLIAFTNKGNACRLKVEDLKEYKWRDKGATLRSVCKELDVDEKFLYVKEWNDKAKDDVLIWTTSQGMLKSSVFSDYDVRKDKFPAIKLKDNDFVVDVEEFDATKTMMMVSEQGKVLNCKLDDIKPIGRVSQGVIGMNLNKDDIVCFAQLVKEEEKFVLATKYGFGKQLCVADIEPSDRARKGMKVFDMPTKDYVFFGAVATNVHTFAVKLDGNFIKKSLSDFAVDARDGKGKSITTNRHGDKLDAIFVLM